MHCYTHKGVYIQNDWDHFGAKNCTRYLIWTISFNSPVERSTSPCFRGEELEFWNSREGLWKDVVGSCENRESVSEISKKNGCQCNKPKDWQLGFSPVLLILTTKDTNIHFFEKEVSRGNSYPYDEVTFLTKGGCDFRTTHKQRIEKTQTNSVRPGPC